MKYGLLKYEEGLFSFNIGDYIQSLAAKQFLPSVDQLISREKLHEYKGEPVKMIMNGWFTHQPENWIPSDDIIPLFVSFHINSTAANIILNKEGVNYLKRHQPIGCRDFFTMNILKGKGIDAYFSGCLTLTLDSYRMNDSEKKNNIYIVDPFINYISWNKSNRNNKLFLKSLVKGEIFNISKQKKYIKEIVSSEIEEELISKYHELPTKIYSTQEKLDYAENLLREYSMAKLVITSRIHCALPCLALNTPVVFLNGFESLIDTCRFDGVLDLLNRIDINFKTGEKKNNFQLKEKINKYTHIENPELYIKLSETLKKTCVDFINK